MRVSSVARSAVVASAECAWRTRAHARFHRCVSVVVRVSVVMCVSVVCDCVLLMLFFYVRWCFSLRAAFDRAWSLLFLSLSVGDARAMARGASSLSLVSCVSSARLFLKHREKIKARYRYFPGGLHGGFF